MAANDDDVDDDVGDCDDDVDDVVVVVVVVAEKNAAVADADPSVCSEAYADRQHRE